MDWSPVIEALQSALISILTAVISVLAVMAVNYINTLKNKAKSQAAAIESENTQKLVNNAIDRLASLAYSTVACLQQEIVPVIKKGIQEGTHTRDDLLELRDEAVDTILSQLSEDVVDLIQLEIADIRGYVENLVSQAVRNIKIEDSRATGSLLVSEDTIN